MQSQALSTMDVKDIATKTAIASIFSTPHSWKIKPNDPFADDFPLVRKLKILEIMEQRTPDTTTAPVTLLSISYIMEVIIFLLFLFIEISSLFSNTIILFTVLEKACTSHDDCPLNLPYCNSNSDKCEGMSWIENHYETQI